MGARKQTSMSMEVIDEDPKIGDMETFCESSFQPWIRHQQYRSQRRAARKHVTQGDFVDPVSLQTKVGIHLTSWD